MDYCKSLIYLISVIVIKVFKNEYDYIIIIMKKCDTLDFKQIEDNLLKVIKEKL